MTKLWTSGGGMNWCWYAQVELHDDGTATIHHEGRLHRFDYSQGAAAETNFAMASRGHAYRIEEPSNGGDWSKPRIANAVTVDGKTYPLREPVGRWSFPDLPPVP